VTTLPSITLGANDPPRVGDTLIGNVGVWNPGVDHWVAQWKHCDAAGANCSIFRNTTVYPGTTTVPYTLTSANDVGMTMKFGAIAYNASGSLAATSGVTAVVVTSSAPSTPAAWTTPATAVTAGSATLNGMIDPNGAPTSFHFDTGTSPTLVGAASTTSASAGSGTDPAARSFRLPDLAASTTYFYRISAESAAGRTAGSILSFTTSGAPAATAGFTVAAAGDISCSAASCPGSSATAALIRSYPPDAVLTLGDNQYENGELRNFNTFFDATWGTLIPSFPMHPAVGNHEYLTANASGYGSYFDGRGVDVGATNGFAYSWDGGGVHFISLNSECSHISACGPENTWLLADIAAHRNTCTLAYWHEPRFTNGEHGNATQMTTIWNTLVRGGVDIVLAGHNHDYEAYDELTASGAPVTPGTRGVREFVVGTGGKNHYPITRPRLPGERVFNDATFGALFLSFHGGSYDWRFRPVAGSTFTDSGSGTCH